MSISSEEVNEAYQSIGEFVVIFQWIENKYREIGWFILDPERMNWPPMQLRKESNQELIDKVTGMFLDLTSKFNFPNGAERTTDFQDLQKIFHELRRFRNRLLHSFYIELKVGGEVQGLVLSNPKVKIDTETDEVIFDQEPFTKEVVHNKIREIRDSAFRLNNHNVQLIHWHPFARFSVNSNTSIINNGN